METILRVAAYAFYGLVAFLLVGAILIQESRGGGLAALGGTRAETAFGASNPVRRLTVVLAVIFFLLAGLIGWWIPRGGMEHEGKRITAPEEPGQAAGEPAAAATDEEPGAPAEETGETPEEPAGAPGAETEGPAAPADEPGESVGEAGAKAEEPATPAAGP